MNDDDLERERAGAQSDAHNSTRNEAHVDTHGEAGLADHDLAALGAFVDGELAPDAQAALLERLADDPAAARRIAAYRAQKAALQSLCNRASGTADATDVAGTAAAPPYLVLRRRDPWWQRAGLAAAWAVVGAGLATAAATFVPSWLGHGDGRASALFASESEGFARRADVAYAVYSPEVRHPVEVGAADEAHLVAWLSKRLGKPLHIPSLGEYGYTLVGGRLLPGAAGPAAQIMYQNDFGERLTLYVSVSGRDRDAVHLLRDGSRRTFYWSTDSMGYALSGPASEGRLRTIAYDVCGALGGTAAQW
ncbi:anti-sigma factor [Paraburkholderia sp. J94]|uniref:anti-sigma factor family protein n=1 Tax=Paraburkholderia sp. J94 TaxID=2805441 RepID=UPI002AB02CC1|nr:anti-sigma factor [Paraburkholderia sp. J94]